MKDVVLMSFFLHMFWCYIVIQESECLCDYFSPLLLNYIYIYFTHVNVCLSVLILVVNEIGIIIEKRVSLSGAAGS